MWFHNREKSRSPDADDIGVDEIEAGIPVMGGDEKDTVTILPILV